MSRATSPQLDVHTGIPCPQDSLILLVSALSFGPQATPPNFDDVMSPNALTGGIM